MPALRDKDLRQQKQSQMGRAQHRGTHLPFRQYSNNIYAYALRTTPSLLSGIRHFGFRLKLLKSLHLVDPTLWSRNLSGRPRHESALSIT